MCWRSAVSSPAWVEARSGLLSPPPSPRGLARFHMEPDRRREEALTGLKPGMSRLQSGAGAVELRSPPRNQALVTGN
jgi:hypothetical protein